ncbi:hypothetical protein BMF89_07515 [Arthrobacter sp. SRS-W-1-2016]|uniref:TM0106 family RecB-like putative nuclease n=1 Tax=Arthrobacter sp. SRS-W-1-2016 TaxID=1930254 RepID=UPI0009C5C64D|nr:TM0106 family RecB-like putative nuclease [Arthrobacter sp. SRS-W-1-2016]OOP63127.1 hypothetical protein BMF89_07515 [Arthrobacter sp. SRS-W-1-2016]
MSTPTVTALSSIVQDWVTKTELMTYVRCPYTYSLLYRGEIDRADLFDEFVLELLAEGQAFHDQVDATAPGIELATAEQLDELFASGVTVLHPPVLFNDDLRIYGMPDGIDPQGGAFWPIEYKSHKDVQPYDELELAFYWLLLSPRRTQGIDDPRGIVVLRRDGEPHPVEVAISSHRLAQVCGLLTEVRQARVSPVQPRLCGCHVCSRVRRDEVLQSTIARRHVSLLFGVGPNYERLLSAVGVHDYLTLLSWNPADLAVELRQRGAPRCAASMIERWQHHARAYRDGKAQAFGDPPPVGDAFIVVDLEYLTPPFGERVWLAGAAVETGAGLTQIHQFWADDTDAEERKLLANLGHLLDAHPQLPVVTWSGCNADLPTTRKAAMRLGVDDPLASREHCDLFVWAQRSVRLPVPSLGLKGLADYFAVPHTSDVANGMQAQLLYRRSTDRTSDPEPDTKQRLLDYNREDLDATLTVSRELKALARGVT